MFKNYLINQGWIVPVYYFSILIILYLLQFITGELYFNNENFLYHDAAHYLDISEKGYHDFRVAFFPLFPKFWDALSISPIAVSILNGVIYIISLIYLSFILKLTKTQLFYSVLIPSNIFFFLPYSESLFFFSSVLILIGISKDKVGLISAGLILAALSRPAYVVLLPAIILAELLSERDFRTKINRIFIYSGCIFLATLTVGFIQFSDSGMWFEFFEAQKLWGNELQVPVLPIRSWAGGFITRLDGVALLIGLISAVVAVSWLIQKFYRKKPVVTDQAIIFSVFYLAGISLMVLLFRGGSLFSLNRFVFATPFFIFFIKYLGNEFMINKKYLFFIGSFVALTAYWLLFFSFVHVQAFLKYELVSIFFLFIIYFINKNRFEPRIYQLLGVLILVELQIYLMLRFLSGEWVA